jgi:hypothetical protein
LQENEEQEAEQQRCQEEARKCRSECFLRNLMADERKSTPNRSIFSRSSAYLVDPQSVSDR